MRHAKKNILKNRFSSWRKATLRSMARNILIAQRMTTTLAKAKASRPMVEKLITLAKANSLAAKRQAYAILGDHALVAKLFGQIGPRFSKSSGGYTRIIHLGRRRGDDAQLAIFELTQIEIKKKAAPAKKAKVGTHAEQKAEQPGISPETKRAATETAVKEKPPITQKPAKKFLKGIKNIFKKERDSL